MHEQMKRLYAAALEIKGISGQSELARALNASPQTVKNWESRGISKKGILDAQTLIGCSALWIEKGIGSMQNIPGNVSSPRPIIAFDEGDPLGEDEVSVPRLTLTVSCGNGHLNWEIDEKGQRNRFRKSWCRDHGFDPLKLATVRAKDHSMFPTIPSGASVTIYTDIAQINDGRVHIIEYMGEHFLKRLFKEPGGAVRVVSDNQDKSKYPDRLILADDLENLRVLGLAVSLSADIY